MTTAVKALASQAAMLVVRQAIAAARASQVALLASYLAPQTQRANVPQLSGLMAYTSEGKVTNQTSQVVMLVAYGTGIPNPSRSRAWTFTLDGHTFYVLDLGPEGTFLFDSITNQWCQFDTQGYGRWNMVAGTMWGQDRIVAGDCGVSQVWEVDPTAVLDEGWRDIVHTSTGGVSTRNRVFISCEAVRVAASIGLLDEVNGTTFTLTFSDDQGQTWSDPFTVSLTEGDFDGEIAYRSLGSFMAPGRIFQLTDVGGLLRIDGADAFLNGFDDDPQQQQQGQ